MGCGFLAEEPGAFDVCGEGFVKVGFCGLRQAFHQEDAGVGDYNVDLAKGF